MKVVMAKTAAQFRRVRAKMADDRHHADMALKTVKDIAAAKAEAKARVEAAQTDFKARLYKLSATVKDQVHKTNLRINQLTNTVTKNKAAQAKINANVNAETKRMIKLGNKRYQ